MNIKNHRNNFRLLAFVLMDVMIISFSYWIGITYISPIEGNFFDIDYWYFYIIVIVVIKIICLAIFNLYKLLLDFVGFSEVMRVLLSTILSSSIIFVLFQLTNKTVFPPYLFVFTIPVEFVLLLAVRFTKRIFISLGLNSSSRSKSPKDYVNTLVGGACSGGKLVLDEVLKNKRLNNKIIAFADDDEEKIGKRLNGIIIVGPIANSIKLVDKYNIGEVIIAIASLDSERLREIIELFDIKKVKIRRLPLMTELRSDSYRNIIDIKIEDLLSRGVVQLNNTGLTDFIRGKTVLVTGGGGSIGSELCAQILNYSPKALIIFDIYENTTYNVQLELQKRIEEEMLETKLITLIGSVYNDKRIESVFKDYLPQLVFHAAAYKHVPLMEDSAVEAVRTNVLGTYNVARLSDKYHVEKMVLVSTDKAVRPTNVMGATKSICEKIIQYFSSISDTSFAAVRFGNVLGSNGSVVPLFKKQIDAGGPVTITDKNITRYFMTIPEAVSLILQSGVYATGGEIFILDMGEPVKIYDLAEKMIRLSGYVPHVDIKIKEIGLRPGEKLFEELLLDRETHMKTENDKIFIERNGKPKSIDEFINEVKQEFEVINNHDVKVLVQKLATTYIIDDKSSNE